MKSKRQAVPAAVWFALMLGLPVAGGCTDDNNWGEKTGEKVDDAAEEVKDVGEDVGDKAEDVVDEAEDAIDKQK